MLHHQDGDTELLADVLDPERHVVGLFHIESGRRFIEQDQAGLSAKRPRHFNHLANPIGQACNECVPIVLKFEKFDHLLDFLARFQLGRTDTPSEKQIFPEIATTLGVAANQQVLQDRGEFEQFNILKGTRDAQCGYFMSGMVGQSECARWAGVIDGPRAWVVDPADQIKNRRLTRTIGANQGEHFAGLNLKTDVFDGEHTAKADAQLLGRQDGAHLSRSDFWNDFWRLNIPFR